MAERAADKLGLSEHQRALQIPSGKHFTYRHRAGWATNELKHAGLVHRPSHGMWGLTQEGYAYVAAHPNRLTVTR